MPARFAVIVDGQTTQGPGLPLEEAAEVVADAHRRAERVEARVVERVGGWRLLTRLETEALAYAAALVVRDA